MNHTTDKPSWWVRLRTWSASREPVIFWTTFVTALLVNVLPLCVTEFLPFSDLPGHLGVVGANLYAGNPATHIHHYFSLHPHFGPNSLEFGLLLGLGKFISLTTAARIVVGLAVTLIPLSMLAMLHAFGRNRWLVFLSLPFAYPRILWYGFVGAALGIGLMFSTIAFTRLAATKRSLWSGIAAASLCFLAGLAHPFFLAATLGLVLLTWLGSVVSQPKSWQSWTSGLIPVPAILIFGSWFAAMASGKASAHPHKHQSILHHILSKRPAWPVYRRWLEEWSLHGYKDRTLEHTILVTLVWTAGILLVSVLFVWTRPLWSRALLRIDILPEWMRRWLGDSNGKSVSQGHSDRPDKTPSHRNPWTDVIPALLLAATVAAYLLLPGVITYPVYWWAVAQRLVTPLLLLVLLAIPRAVPKPLARLAGIVGLVLGMGYALFLTKDFSRHFAGRQMAGFHRLLNRIPPGKRLLALYDDREKHYAHFPLHFASVYYVALRGGFSMPFPVVAGYKSIAWAYPKRVPPSPAWGKLRFFSYRRHARFYDYFLVKEYGGKKLRWKYRFKRGCIQVVEHRGLWTLIRRLHKKGC